jgi:hypothetical protein
VSTTVFKESFDKNYDSEHKASIDKAVDLYINNKIELNQKQEKQQFKFKDLEKALKSLKNSKSSGSDGINNIILKKIPTNFKQYLIKIYEKSFKDSTIPTIWKRSIITLIPKKGISNEIKNFRPISLTSCVLKLMEKLVLNKVLEFTEQNNIFNPQQSGFRKHRSTVDNIVTLTQKIRESFNRKKNTCAIFFDISQAFD